MPLLSFGDRLCPFVARGAIGGVTEGSGLGAEVRLAQLCVGVGYRVGGQLIGGPVRVLSPTTSKPA